MTYNVFGGMLSLTQSINYSSTHYDTFWDFEWWWREFELLVACLFVSYLCTNKKVIFFWT